MPKFYVLTIDELPGVFFRGLIVGAYELDCAADMAILVKNVARYSAMCGPQGNLSSTEIVFCQFGSRL